MSNNNKAISEYSNLMLVDVIYGNSGKYTQDDVLTAELELSGRNLSDFEMQSLRKKVSYIGSINMGGSPDSSPSTSETLPDDNDEEYAEELEGHDEILIKVLMVYFVFCALGSAASLLRGFHLSTLFALVGLAIYVYGVYGLLNRLSQPIIFLIGIVTYVLVNKLIWMLNFSFGFNIIILITIILNGAILYFLTKSSMRSAFRLDNDSIKKAMMVGSVAAILMRFI